VCTRPRIAIDSREIDRQVKESSRTSVSIYRVLDDVLAQLGQFRAKTRTPSGR
jgi:hypothetical protein